MLKARQYKKTLRDQTFIPMPTSSICLPASELPDTNVLMNLGTLQSQLNSMSRCAHCNTGKLALRLSSKCHGSVSYLTLSCNACDSESSFWSSGCRSRGTIAVGDSTIMSRSPLIYSSVLSGRLMGIGWAKLHLYHSFLNLPGPISCSNFTLSQADLLVVAKVVAEQSMNIAVNQLRAIHNVVAGCQYVEVVGTFDGAYQQRSGKAGGGFSRYCFAAAIAAQTGKVLSYGVACNSCALCNSLGSKLRESVISDEEFEERMAVHKPLCSAEYADFSSVQLESAIAPKVIEAAMRRGVLFSAIVSDGDNKTHDVLAKAAVYKDLSGAPTIERFECIAHVAKRMKTHLHKRQDKVLKTARADKGVMARALTKKGLGKKEVSKTVDPLFKGKTQRSSKGRESWDSRPGTEIRHLTLALCGQVASYYRLAVQRNAGDVASILGAIKAIPLHLSATDQNAEINHRYCPSCSDTWCRYQQAISKCESPPSHPNYLGAEATSIITDLFTEFGYDSPEFIAKISQGLSSNHNESIHSVLFTMVHKTDAIGMDVMELGSALAVIRYNEGFAGIERLCHALHIEVTSRLKNAFETIDDIRARHKVHTIRDQQKRYHKKQRRGRKSSKQLTKGPAPYCSGEYSGAKSSRFSESSSDDEIAPISDVASPSANPSCDSSLDVCNICKGTEENRLVGIGLGMRIIDEEVDWVQCNACDKWYHLLCLDIDDPEDIGEEYYCPNC